jgi:hypothetical protein
MTEEARSTDESEGSANEEELKEKRRHSRPQNTSKKPSTKKARVSNGTGTTLAIRSANVPSKSASHKVKVQKARARQSQVDQEGLYGKYPRTFFVRLRG